MTKQNTIEMTVTVNDTNIPANKLRAIIATAIADKLEGKASELFISLPGHQGLSVDLTNGDAA